MIQPVALKSLNIAMKIFQCYCATAHLECVKDFYKEYIENIISINKQHNIVGLKLEGKNEVQNCLAQWKTKM